MGWDGALIKTRLADVGSTQRELAERLGVSRISLSNWIKGQVPKGSHLVALCRELGVGPDHFFRHESALVTVPLHRTRRKARVAETAKSAAEALVASYAQLFREAPDPGLVPVARLDGGSEANVLSLSRQMREASGIEEDEPIDYHHAFRLLFRLGIVVVFRQFAPAINSYAFYSKIHGHRVVFVGTDTNLLDLIFPLLHEAVHAVRDEMMDVCDSAEEAFCDRVASHVQFPDGYVARVARRLNGKPAPVRIRLLKEIAEEHHHSLYGIAKRLESTGIKLDVGGADTNLKRRLKTSVGDVLFCGEDPVTYIERLRSLSPMFMRIVATRLESSSDRMFGEWLGLEGQQDSTTAKKAFATMQKMKA